MSPREYTPGDTVFAKLKGYPWWPARVENDKDIPPKILKQKGKSKGVLYTVFFYGSRDYGFFGPDCVRPFDREAVERDLKAKKFKTKDLELAIHQALDPSILKAEEEAERLAAEEDDDEEEEEEEEVKPKRKTKAAATKKKAPAKKRNNKRIIEEDEDEDMEEEEDVPKRKTQRRASTQKNKRVADVDSDSERKKRRKSLSMEQEDSEKASSRKSEEPVINHHNIGQIETVEELSAFKKTVEYKKVYHMRHKLQKLVYEKKPGEIQKEDYAKISQVVKEIEDATMSYDLLRYTKIGKVVKFACSYDYGEDEYKINQRCQQIMKNWKYLILPESRTAEQHE